MPITAQYAPITSPSAGDAAPIPVTWPFADPTDLVVYERITATGVETEETYGVDYTVTWTPVGGTIVPLRARPVGTSWIVERSTELTQPSPLRNGGPYNPETIEGIMNRSTLQIQELREAVPAFPASRNRTALAPLVFNSNGGVGAGSSELTGDMLLRPELAAGTDALFTQAGVGAVARGMRNKMRETVTPEDFGAVGNGVTNDTAAVQAALTASRRVSFINTYLCGPLTLRTGQVITGTGTIQSTGAGTLLACPVGQTGIVVENVELVGALLTNDSNVNDVGLYLPENGFTVRDVRVRQFASAGILLGTNVTPSLGVYERPNEIRGCKITRNGCGIDTRSFEYVSIQDNLIAENGFNAARTGFVPARTAGAGCAGIVGNLANIAVSNNVVTANAYGISMVAGAAAPNPDHNMISGNTINHNMACGLYIAQNKNYEAISNNTILSTVGDAGAPTVVPIGGVARDMILIDAHALNFTGNAIGSTDVYGQGRCRYVNNNFLISFVELSNPDAGSPLAVTWGITTNSYNRWENNWFFAFTRPTLFNTNANNIISGNIEGANNSVDDVLRAPTLNADWISPATGGGTYTAIKYWREAGNRVRVMGSVQRTAGATTVPFTLPAGFRPAGFVDLPAIQDGSGTHGMVRVSSAGVVSLFNPTTGQPFIFDVTFPLA